MSDYDKGGGEPIEEVAIEAMFKVIRKIWKLLRTVCVRFSASSVIESSTSSAPNSAGYREPPI
jgi:hypothetical protein